MGNSETFEFLIYGLRVCSIILIVLGGILLAFDFLDAIPLINLGLFVLIFSYYIFLKFLPTYLYINNKPEINFNNLFQVYCLINSRLVIESIDYYLFCRKSYFAL